jgi:VWFA-related protein
MSRLAAHLLVLLCAAPLARAQGEPSPPGVRVPVQTELVRIDVMVSDKSGRPQLGLTAQDFEVLEDGVPQRVSQFRSFAAPSAGAVEASTPAAPGADAPAAAALPEAPPHRLVLLAVDDIHIETGNLMRLKKTLDRFLERDVPPEDLVGLVTTSGALSHPLTTDRNAVRVAVSRLSAQSRRAAPVAGAAHITDYQAEMIELGDPEALRAAVEEIEAARPSPNAEAEARALARVVLSEAVADARATLATLDAVVRGMADLPGRKVLVLCSDGFLTGLSTGGLAAFDIRRITDAGTRSGVVVYGLDSRGLQANTPGPSASSRRMVLPGIVGARERVAQAGELAIHDAMHALASDTGGFLQAFTNDFGGALRKIVHDTDAYYLLAYEPTNSRHDGAFRKIEVRVPRLKGARVRHRKGYLAPDANAAAAGDVTAGGGAVPPASVDPLRAALSSTDPADGLTVGLSADFASVDGTTSQLAVSGHVDLRDVPFTRSGGRHLATLDVAASVFDEAGTQVQVLPVERAPLDLDDASHALALRNGLQFQRAVPLPPGRYRVVLAAREADRGTIGKATQWAEVPDLADGRLALSSLFLKKQEGAAAGSQQASAKAPALRNVQANRFFRPQDSLSLEFFVYRGGEPSRAGLVSSTELWQDGRLLSASRAEALAPRDGAGRPRAHTRKFALGAFPPGSYEVRVVVLDEQGTEASARASFRIE